MKQGSEILRHMLAFPRYKRLQRHRCYIRFLRHLPKKWQYAVAFTYVKNETLFLALRHPGFKNELNYNKELMKNLLAAYASRHPECDIPTVTNVQIFASKFHTPQTPKVDTVPRYTERAEGNFRLEIHDEALRTQFEKIRRWIVSNRS